MTTTLKEIKEDVLRKVFIEQPDTAPESIKTDVLHAINQAFQLLNTAGHPFWRESHKDKTFSGTDPQTLTGVQRVNKVVNADGRNLLRVSDEHKVKFAHEIYSGQLTAGSDYSATVYCVAVEMDDTTQREVLKLHIGPQPLVAQTVTVYYLSTFTPYTKDQIEQEGVMVSVPFAYIETILLPVARYLITRCHWFKNDRLLPQLREDYQTAISIMRDANPELKFPEPVEQPTRESRKS